MFATLLPAFLATLQASAAFIPTNSSNPVNGSIAMYTDPVLMKVAMSPPMNTTMAQVNFTNGLVMLPGAYFQFTEMAGTVVNLTTTMIQFAFPSNLSTTNNIFAYHVHENPVAYGDNTCLSTGGHYDPFVANGTEGLVNKTGGYSPLYNPNTGNLSTFQVGDLAGKWGALTTDNGTVAPRAILEHYIRLSGQYSVMNRSVVIHDAPTDTRIACGNITMVTAFTTTSSNSSSTSSSSSSGSKSSSSSGGSSGAAPINAVGLGAVAATMAAMFGTMALML